jgi:2'-5' RNA ligase
MYAVIALLDEKTEEKIKEIWKELKEKSISYYADEVENRRPHITLASYLDINLSKMKKEMDNYFDNQSAISVTFQTLGSFLNSSTLIYLPTVTRELLEFHAKYHEHFQDFQDNPNSLYLPGQWIPHCTLANRLPEEKLLEAIAYTSRRYHSVKGYISEIALIETIYENNKCVKAPILFSKKLKNESPIN